MTKNFLIALFKVGKMVSWIIFYPIVILNEIVFEDKNIPLHLGGGGLLYPVYGILWIVYFLFENTTKHIKMIYLSYPAYPVYQT